LLCGLASSPPVLIGARFVHGIGAALTSAVVLGMIVTLFPRPVSPSERAGQGVQHLRAVAMPIGTFT
jgi:MFS family permease